jgi:hypothetical protein
MKYFSSFEQKKQQQDKKNRKKKITTAVGCFEQSVKWMVPSTSTETKAAQQ